MSPITCDIFCTVIDNFGDIGVCWRLARQLDAEHGWRVRLLVDDLHTFQKLCPALSTDAPTQTIEGVTIERWRANTEANRNAARARASMTGNTDTLNDAHDVHEHDLHDVHAPPRLPPAASAPTTTSDYRLESPRIKSPRIESPRIESPRIESPYASADMRTARAYASATGQASDTGGADNAHAPPRPATDTHAFPPTDVVIEAFACNLPPAYVDAMARRARKPVWLNLEYLGTEDWVADFHLRPSPHPRHALTKTFFFPGLGPGTGGVPKERDLDAARAAFEASPDARAAWWHHATGDAPPSANDNDDANDANATVISLFAYDNPALDRLLAQWRDAPAPIVLLAPQGHVSRALARFFGVPSFGAGAHARQGSLRAYGLAFTAQRDYDPLLWASDINFVRGEDSFVRAQWAARPFVWHIYPQADDAHLPKLDAALARYARTLPAATQRALHRFWHAWNGKGEPDWADFAQHLPALRQHAAAWSAELAQTGELAGNLVRFVKSQL